MEIEQLIEVLADIEHQQWVYWSQDVAASENISEERLARWKSYWVPYAELSEDVKEHDRTWSRLVVARMKENSSQREWWEVVDTKDGSVKTFASSQEAINTEGLQADSKDVKLIYRIAFEVNSKQETILDGGEVIG